MGGLRYLLSCAVVASHLGITLYGYNIGVMAVVVFYLLAGQVVVKLWQKKKELPFKLRLKAFYKDRFLRIAPMYMMTLAVAAGLWWWLEPDSYFVSRTPSVWDWVANFIVVPLAYFMYTGQDQFTLLPPAWSLAVELQFYLIVPFLLQARWRVVAAFWLSVMVFVVAQTQHVNIDYFGYRLLPGVLFLFVLGAFALNPTPRKRCYLWMICGFCCFYAAFLVVSNRTVSFNFEVTVGLVCGLIFLLKRSNTQQRPAQKKWQALLGAWSYGVFLVHMPVMWLVQPYIESVIEQGVIVVVISTVYAALCHHFFERPVWGQFRPRFG